MKFEDYRQYDATGLAELIRQREVSPAEVMQAALTRLDEVNPRLNLLAQDLRDRLDQADPPAHDESAPLAGVPFMLKDLLADLAGAPTMAGSRMMKNKEARRNSVLTQAYLDAGLRIFGKTTTPEFGLYPCTASDCHGTTRNPWDLDHTPGGSSGGSAAAVAAGIVPAAHGGDGGGSIRLPAHNCGVFGLKPSRGRSSFLPGSQDVWLGMVSEHALTRSVRDSALLLEIAARTQHQSIYACPPAPAFTEVIRQPPARLKIAVHRSPWLGGENDEGTTRAFEHSIRLLEKAGHHLEEASPDFTEPETLGSAMRIIVSAEIAKIRHVYRHLSGQKLHHSQVEAATWALMVQGDQISAGKMSWARDLLLRQGMATSRFFAQYDMLMTPVCPQTTPRVGELRPSLLEQRLVRQLFGVLRLGWLIGRRNPAIEKASQQALQYVGYTAPFNFSGNPAMSVPLYWHEGLPVGTQFAAAHGREDLLLQLAAELEQQQPWAMREPTFRSGRAPAEHEQELGR
ncbi:MAG: amidase family protein [Lautropia sp.]|nr:amidase family protein [Lautropia sp.]